MNSIRKNAGVCCFFLFTFVSLSPLLYAQSRRSLDDIFPGLTQDDKSRVFTNEGLKYNFERNESPRLIPDANTGIDLASVVLAKTPSHLVEALLVVPYNEREIGLLDAYNAAGRIRNIKDHLYFSKEQNRNIVIFREAARLQSERRKTPIPDPQPSTAVPLSETIFIRLDDANYGTLYIRGDITSDQYGLTYNMTNFEAVRFLLFTIMKAEKFSAVVYIEPVEEGMLVYGMAGIDLPDFVIRLINVSSDIDRRFTVLVNWMIDGLRRQGSQNRNFR